MFSCEILQTENSTQGIILGSVFNWVNWFITHAYNLFKRTLLPFKHDFNLVPRVFVPLDERPANKRLCSMLNTSWQCTFKLCNEYSSCYQVILTVMQLSLTSVLLWTNTLESFLCVGLLTPSMSTGLQRAHVHTVLPDIPRGTRALVGVKLLLTCAVTRTRAGQAVTRHLSFTSSGSVYTSVNVDLFSAYKNTWRPKNWQRFEFCSIIRQCLFYTCSVLVS